MNGLGYIIASWVLVMGSIAAYSARLLQRGRALTRRVPPERQRWMSAKDDA